jgi:hypothetical protein
MTRRCDVRLALIGVACIEFLSGESAHASLSRNAAGPKNMGEAGTLTVDTAGELGSEPDGKVWIFETGMQYQVTGRLQVLAEAVLFERQEPDGLEGVSGIGDTDLTVSWLAVPDREPLPAVVLGAKVKLPTAADDEIGTGEADYSALLVVAKETESLELNIETEYATFGSPPEEELKDQFIYTFTAEYSLSDLLAAYVEVFGNSAPTEEESRTDAALVGVEMDVFASDEVAPYVSLELDTEETASARAGIEWTW